MNKLGTVFTAIGLGIACALLVALPVWGQDGGSESGLATFYTVGNAITDVALSGDYVWVSTSGGVVRWHRQTGSYLKFTTRDGLPSNEVNTIETRADGSIWIGTSDGAAWYDGERWQPVTAQGTVFDQYIREIAFSPDEELWMAIAGEGIYVIHVDGTWDIYTTSHGLISSYVEAIAFEDDGTAWIGTNDGLSRLGTDGVWDTYTETHGLAANTVKAIAIDSAGNRWFGGAKFDFVLEDWAGGVTQLTPGGSWITYTVADGLINENVTAIAIEDNGDHWFGTSRGLSHFSSAGMWTSWGWDSDLPSPDITGLGIDETNQIWIGTSGGLAKYDGAGFTNYIILDGPISRDTNALDVDASNGLWIAASNAVQRFDGQNWQQFTTADGLSSNGAGAVKVAPDGSIWLGQRDPSRWISSTGWITYPSPELSNAPDAIGFDVDGSIWFGEYNGLVHFDGANWTDYSSALASESKIVGSIAISGNDRWFGGWPALLIYGGEFHFYDAGLHHFDGATWETFTATHGLLSASRDSHAEVHDLAFDQDGVLWLTNSYGVQCHDGITFTNVYTSGNSGLPPIGVNAVAIGSDGRKWFGTYRGVSVFDGATWKVYTTAHGLAADMSTQLVFDQVGNLWIASPSGISVLNEAGLTQQQTVPENGGTIKSLEGDTIVVFPESVFTTTAVVTITSKPISPTGSLVGVSHAFDLQAVDANTGEILQPVAGENVTITFRYAGIDVPLGVDERSLRLYRWTDTGWQEAGISNTVDTAENIVTAAVTQLGTFAVLGAPSLSIVKSVTPSESTEVQYGDWLTYTLLISATPGTQVRLYDPLQGTTFKHFVEQPENIIHVNNVITGALTITPAHQITVSFAVEVGIPNTVGWLVDVVNRACLYPLEGTLDDCIWSNTVTNAAFRPYNLYLPLVMKHR